MKFSPPARIFVLALLAAAVLMLRVRRGAVPTMEGLAFDLVMISVLACCGAFLFQPTFAVAGNAAGHRLGWNLRWLVPAFGAMAAFWAIIFQFILGNYRGIVGPILTLAMNIYFLPLAEIFGGGASARREESADLPLHEIVGTPGPWQTFVSERGKFQVELPGTPQELSHTENDGEFSAVQQITRLVLPDGLLFHIVWSEVKNLESAGPAEIQNFLNQMIRDFSEFDDTLSKVEPLQLNGFPGRGFRNSSPDGNNVTTADIRMYVVGSRHYSVMAESQTYADEHREAMDRFLKSFMLV